jgi:hypothetical protein
MIQDIVGEIAKYYPETVNSMWNVNTEWRSGLSHIINGYEDDLCKQFDAMRINTQNAPSYLRRHVLLLMKEKYFACPKYRCAYCGANVHQIGACLCYRIPLFPWKKALIGPLLSLTLLLLFTKFPHKRVFIKYIVI